MEFEDDPVSRLLGGLKRVEAPGDFDFRVKARIAAGRPVDRTASWLPNAVRFAVPLGLLLLIGGYFGFNALYSFNKVDVPPIAEVRSTIAAPVIGAQSNESVTLPANPVIAERVEIKPTGTDSKINTGSPEKRIVSFKPSEGQPGGGSYDEARRTPRQFYPKGIDPNRKLLVPKDFEGNTRVAAKNILSFIGIDAVYSGSSWKVGLVKQNSIAERSGMKAGDVIEAINDLPLTEKTAFGNKFSGKSIRVRRDGKSMQIDLKP